MRDKIKVAANNKAYKAKHKKRLAIRNKELKQNTKYHRKDSYVDKQLQRKYGITLEQYNTMLEQQGYECGICGIHQDDLKRRMCVDHNHTTNIVRGLLCDRCNMALGHLSDDIDTLKNAINYLNERC